MIKDLCSEGAYQEGTYVIFNLILIQFAEIVFLSSLWFVWLLFPIVSTLATRVGSSFLLLISITTDFLRYAPCMRKVKNEYEKCAESYKNIMKKIHEQKTAETFTSTTTTSTTTIPPRIVQISLMKRQQSSQSIYVSHETTTTARNASNEAMDQGEVQIKTVCWWVVWWLRLNLRNFSICSLQCLPRIHEMQWERCTGGVRIRDGRVHAKLPRQNAVVADSSKFVRHLCEIHQLI